MRLRASYVFDVRTGETAPLSQAEQRLRDKTTRIVRESLERKLRNAARNSFQSAPPH